MIVRGGSGWENYELETLPNNVLRISGSDDRGAMFGLYRFASDFLGVDPFYYWSGFEPEKTSRREWKDGISLRQGDPSFRFRGWFVNDEDFLNGFRPEENGVRKIDYPRYHVCFGTFLADKIYEAAVRAGFNMMVCASYVDILNPDEKRLVDIASSRGLYITMHHQEPVGASALFLDLHFPETKGTTYASHPDLWRKAWKTYIGEWAKVPDVIWQLGLRGRKDIPFWGKLNSDGSWNADWGRDCGEAEDRRRAKLISDAMAEQVDMIREATKGRPFRTAVQLWMESVEFYRKGYLTLPPETMVVFSDNCPGLKFQPDLGAVAALPEDRAYGLYYHLAVIHGNHHCELVPPSRTSEVLSDAWGRGACEFLLVNVSNVRPFLYTIGAMGEMSRSLSSFDPSEFQRRWIATRFGQQAVPTVSRAFDLYFSAYETVYSRDTVSSYGSPRERAPLPVLNDGEIISRIFALLWEVEQSPRKPVFASPYEVDPDRLVDVGGSMHTRVHQDEMTTFVDDMRCLVRARAQAASFGRCLDQVELAEERLSEPACQLLFERVGYPAAFMRAASECCAEVALAVAAHREGGRAAVVRHLQEALRFARERDALDKRYNAGRWAHWYDRNIIYPYPQVSERIEAALNALRGRK